MKRFFIFGIWILMLTSCTTTPRTPEGFELPKYDSIRLDNGLEVLLIPEKELPSISMVMMIKTGSSADPLGKSGLMLLTSNLLERGTKTKSANEIADAFGFYGSGIGVDVDSDFSSLSTVGLSRDREQLLKMFAEVILQPVFINGEVTRIKNQLIGSIKRSYDEPDDFTDRVFQQYMLGSHPYSRPVEGSVRDVNAIRQKDVIQHYLKWFRPNNAIFAIVGDYDEAFVAAIKEQFGGWKPKDVETIRFPPVPKSSNLQLSLVERDDLAQAQIRLGHTGIRRTNPDFLTLRVANTILGGSFSSRLMNEIRVKRGLTYGIYSTFNALLDEGPFEVSTFTRFDKVGETISETLRVLREFREKGVTDSEVENAVGYLKGAFPRAIETPEQLAQNLLVLRFYGIPDSYLTDYISNIKKISKDDVNRVIAKYFHPNQMKVLIYSVRDPVIDQLRPIGALEVHPYRDFL